MPIAWYKARIPGLPWKSMRGKEQVVFRCPPKIPKYQKNTAFTRTLSESSRELLPTSLWHESGTQRKLLSKTCSDELFIFWVDFFGWIFLLWVFLEGPESPKIVSCSSATPGLHRCESGLLYSKRHFWVSPALARKTTFSFPCRFSGKSRTSGLVPGNRDPNTGIFYRAGAELQKDGAVPALEVVKNQHLTIVKRRFLQKSYRDSLNWFSSEFWRRFLGDFPCGISWRNSEPQISIGELRVLKLVKLAQFRLAKQVETGQDQSKPEQHKVE